MKITITPTEQDCPRSNYPEISISIPDDDLLLAEVIDGIIRPALIAWGFDAKTVNEYIGPS